MKDIAEALNRRAKLDGAISLADTLLARNGCGTASHMYATDGSGNCVFFDGAARPALIELIETRRAEMAEARDRLNGLIHMADIAASALEIEA